MKPELDSGAHVVDGGARADGLGKLLLRDRLDVALLTPGDQRQSDGNFLL